VIHGGSKSVNLFATKDNPSFDVNAQHVQVSSTGMFGPIPSKSIGRFGNTSSIATEVTSDSVFTSSLNEVGLPQSPLVSLTAPLPLHQSNVDIAATFGFSLSTVDDLEVFIDALGAMCDLICVSRPGESDDLEVGKNALWLELAEETRSGISNIICDRWNTLLNLQKSALISTSYAGATGASSEDQPKVNSNFHPLVADHVFDFVNISIPRKFIKKEQLGKHGLKIIMMNTKGFFFFFKFDSRAGLEAVLEGGHWVIRNSPIILKKWSMDTRLLKEIDSHSDMG
ncbi:zinc knuckle CX2CX4HX4C containing protein, partial [Tanacetum coccineum]